MKKINPSPNFFFSILSVSLLLFLLLSLGGFWIFSKSWMTNVKENLNLVIELKTSTQPAEVADLKSKLEHMPETISSSYVFISKEKAFEKMRAEMGEEMLSDEFPNPLRDVVTINLKEEFIDQNKISNVRSEIEALSPIVDATYFQENVFSNGLSNLSKVLVGGLSLVLLVFIVAITIIFNTTKLSLFSNRHLIKNMELVGAKSSFILKPFLGRSLKHGILSSILALVFMAVALYGIVSRYPISADLVNYEWAGSLVVAVIAVGVLINVATTHFIVRRYLRLRMNEMF